MVIFIYNDFVASKDTEIVTKTVNSVSDTGSGTLRVVNTDSSVSNYNINKTVSIFNIDEIATIFEVENLEEQPVANIRAL